MDIRIIDIIDNHFYYKGIINGQIEINNDTLMEYQIQINNDNLVKYQNFKNFMAQHNGDFIRLLDNISRFIIKNNNNTNIPFNICAVNNCTSENTYGIEIDNKSYCLNHVQRTVNYLLFASGCSNGRESDYDMYHIRVLPERLLQQLENQEYYYRQLDSDNN